MSGKNGRGRERISRGCFDVLDGPRGGTSFERGLQVDARPGGQPEHRPRIFVCLELLRRQLWSTSPRNLPPIRPYDSPLPTVSSINRAAHLTPSSSLLPPRLTAPHNVVVVMPKQSGFPTPPRPRTSLRPHSRPPDTTTDPKELISVFPSQVPCSSTWAWGPQQASKHRRLRITSAAPGLGSGLKPLRINVYIRIRCAPPPPTPTPIRLPSHSP